MEALGSSTQRRANDVLALVARILNELTPLDSALKLSGTVMQQEQTVHAQVERNVKEIQWRLQHIQRALNLSQYSLEQIIVAARAINSIAKIVK
jgi:hypothetical protein